MTEQEIEELAAILVNEHGYAARLVAERRRDQYSRAPGSDTYQLWEQIGDAVDRLLEAGRV